MVYLIRSSIRFDVDVIQVSGPVAKSANWIPPAVSISRGFFFSPGRIHMEVNLEKTCIAHDEALFVHVTILNHSNKSVTKMKVFLLYFAA